MTRYRCPACKKTRVTEDVKQAPGPFKRGLGTYTCSWCDASFDSKEELKTMMALTEDTDDG